jgi:hypothetical protein
MVGLMVTICLILLFGTENHLKSVKRPLSIF